MAESAALLADDVLQGYPIRQWVLSLPIPLRLLLARYPSELSKVMVIIYRAISTHIVSRGGFSNKHAKTGAVTIIQRFGSALNLNIHFHKLFLEGAISENPRGGRLLPASKRLHTTIWLLWRTPSVNGLPDI